MGTEGGTQRESPPAPPEPAAESSAVLDVLVSAILPGLPTLRRRRWLGSVLLALGVLAPLVWLAAWIAHDRSWVVLGLDRRFLAQLMAVLVIVVSTRIVAVGEVLLATRTRPRRALRLGIAGAVVVGVIWPCAVGADTAADARADIDRAFEDNSNAPIYDALAVPATTVAPPAATTVPPTDPVHVRPATTTTTTTLHVTPRIPYEVVPQPPRRKPTRPDSGVDPSQLSDVSTILLLGGDAGPGRSGLRTDSMILVSIHRPSGRAALISVPRNLEHLLFPPGSPLEQRYPYGFDEIANAVYPIVSSNESLRDAYRVGELRPGAVATAQGIGYSLDVTIDDYVLIDMQGFLEVIDALGGVTVDVRKAVPTPGNPPGAKHPVPPVIEAGVQYMDGTLALAYVRSRKSDTDYHRARRQRDVLGALARQVSLADALTGYSAVTSALGDSLRTSLTTEEFTNLLALLGGETAIVESVGLVPPLVSPGDPDYDGMAKIVGEIQVALVTGVPSGY
jgi:LCP family protein required for cell wall assembly